MAKTTEPTFGIPGNERSPAESFALPARIETIRLLLRPPTLEDVPFVFKHWSSDPDTVRYLSWPIHRSVQDTQAFIKKHLEKTAQGKSKLWFITRLGDNNPIGYFLARNYDCRVEIACALMREHWAKGYMFEVGKTVVDLIFEEQPNIVRVDALVSTDNHTASRMLEKCGAKLEGVLKQAYPLPNNGNLPADFSVYAMLREDWERLQAYPNRLLRRLSGSSTV